MWRQRQPPGCLHATLLQPYNLLLIFLMTILNLICNFYIQTQADQARSPCRRPRTKMLA